MTMHPDSWPPRRAGLHVIEPIENVERLASHIDAATPGERAGLWERSREYVAVAVFFAGMASGAGLLAFVAYMIFAAVLP